MRCVTAAVGWLRTFGVTACNRVSHGAHGDVRRPTYAIPRAQPAHHFVRAHPRRPSSHAGRAWKPAPTVGIRISPTLPQPLSHGAKRRDSSPFRGAEGVGGGLRRLHACFPRCCYLRSADARNGRRPRRPAVAGLPGCVGCSCWAWPIAPTFPTARILPSTAQRIISRGHRPRTILCGRGGCLARRTAAARHPAEGASRTPPPTGCACR